MNVCANNDANTRRAQEEGALGELVHLVSTSQVPVVQSIVVGAIGNLTIKRSEIKAEFIHLGATEILRDLGATWRVRAFLSGGRAYMRR